MAGIRLWTWNFVCCVLVKTVSSQTIVNQYDWESEVSSKKGRSTYSLKNRPNIIIILADDMGWGDMGANWAETTDTPNLDALAKGGLRLSDLHSGASVCAPSRAALLTGRLGLRTGVVRNFGAAALGGLPRNETTFAEMLRAAGYRTAMLGKWHLGLQPGHHPLDKGFDKYLGVPYSIDMGCTDSPAANLPPCPTCPLDESATSHRNASRVEGGCFEDLALPLIKDRDIIHQPTNLSTLAEQYARFGEDFILTTSEGRPFLLYAALAHVHVPLATGARFAEASRRGPLGAALRELDWLTGRLAKAADAARRDTLLWFLSDNGPWEAKCTLAGSAGPYLGSWQRSAAGGGGGSASKRTVWEGGHRTPSFVRWPSHVPGGRVSGALASALDVLPTLAALTGAALPAARSLDGRDISALLLHPDPPAAPLRQVLFHPNSGAAGEQGQIGAVRVGDLKVVYFSGGAATCGGAQGPPRALRPPLVFDVGADPAEARPLGGQVAAAAREKAARALDALQRSVRADNTSRADYRSHRPARPCCSSYSAVCRCLWD
ncbi:hypothetical protein R5R35_003721 [Gryllus longicercus]|uniref:Sulfatase N-terminal domain-containing protein n=1 Tax=Gryllus longicercus TaxID=2509291 RepID=A0AAN9VS31_9ORTH